MLSKFNYFSLKNLGLTMYISLTNGSFFPLGTVIYGRIKMGK